MCVCRVTLMVKLELVSRNLCDQHRTATSTAIYMVIKIGAWKMQMKMQGLDIDDPRHTNADDLLYSQIGLDLPAWKKCRARDCHSPEMPDCWTSGKSALNSPFSLGAYHKGSHAEESRERRGNNLPNF